MRSIVILVWGLLPAVLVLVWEARRQRRRDRFAAPVSPEAIRWCQYLGGAYEIGFAGLALAWLDGQEPSVSALLVVLSTCLTSALMLRYLGQRYGSETPRLTDMREQCYRCRTQLWRRARLLSRQAYHTGGQERWSLRADLNDAVALTERCDRQLKQLQLSLTTDAFLRRVRYPSAGQAEIRSLQSEQADILARSAEYLAATAPAVGAASLELQLVYG